MNLKDTGKRKLESPSCLKYPSDVVEGGWKPSAAAYFIRESVGLSLNGRLQFQYMSIRRVRRKQVINLVNEQEERAKEKLFEISYFDDQRHFDESRILLPDTGWQRQMANQTKPVKIKKVKEAHKKKSQSLCEPKTEESSIEKLTHRRGNKTLQLASLPEPSPIFNTLESNRVFVGNKNAAIRSARDKASEMPPVWLNKKRIETMPAVKQNSYIQLPKEDRTANNKTEIALDLPKQKIWRPQKWRTHGLLTQKNADRESYIKLRMKMKRDIFKSLEEKLTLNHYFLN